MWIHGNPRWFSGVILLGVLELLPYVKVFETFFRSLRVQHTLSNMDTT